MDITDILRGLAAVRRRIRTAYLLHGLGSTLLWLVAVALFLFGADYFLVLPPAVRLVLLGAGLALVAAAVWRRVLFPLSVRITDDDVALCVEQAHPGLQEKVISAVQLSRRTDPDSLRIHSGAMVEATAREAVEAMREVRLGPVVRSGGALRTFATGLVLLAGLVTVGLLHEDLASIWMQRALGSGRPWPQRTGLEVIEPGSRHVRVARGENFVVKVRVTRDVPSRVRLLFTFLEDDEEGEADCVQLDENTFQYFLPNVIQDFRFQVTAGDATSEPYHVEVLVPPRIEGVRVRLEPPAYTQLPAPPPGEWSQRTGNVKAPVGTRVRFEADLSPGVASAELRFSKEGLAAVPLDLAGRTASGAFAVAANGSYAVHLEGSNGLSNRMPSRYSLRAVPDQAPFLKLSWPRYNEQVTPQASLPVRGLLRDDYGLARARLLLRRPSSDEALTTALPVELPDTPFGEKEVPFETVVDLPALRLRDEEGKALPLTVGTVFLLAVEAFDHRPAPGPNRSATRPVQLEVVSREELERAVESRMIQIRERIGQLRRTQEEVRGRMAELLATLREARIWDRGDLETLLSSEVTQRRVTRNAERVHEDFLRVLDTVVYNKLGDPDYIGKLREMSEMMELVARDRSPAALRHLEKARMAKERNLQERAASETLEAQRLVLGVLDDLLSRMTRWEDYNEIVRAFRELRDIQERILEKTNDLTKKK